jgi:integrase
VLSAQDMASLFAKATGDHLYSLWCLLLTSGLRPGEALALRWSDITKDALHVRRTLVGDGRGNFSIAEAQAKRKDSIRSVTLPAVTLEVLDAHRKKQAVQILAMGETYERNGLIFATDTGTVLDPCNVSKRWKRMLKLAGLPAVRLYDTRHSHATALLTKGVNLAWVSDRLGHSDVKLTKDVYAHVMPEAHREMADVMEQIIMAKVQQA